MDELKEIEKIEKAQVKDSKGKYKQQLRANNVEVHEYVSPLGSGYQILLYKEIDGVEYIKSKAHGPEAESRTWDWRASVDE